MAYQKFTTFGAGSRDKSTLRASGYLFVPRAICQAVGEASPKRVTLYFDPDEKKLAVVPFDPLFELESESRETSVEPSGVAINIVPLLRVYGLAKPEKKLMLDSTAIEFDGRKAIEVDMSDVPEVAEDIPPWAR